MSTIIMNLRGARVTPIHRGSVLLSKQEDLGSTSHYSSSRETSALRVTSYYSSRRKNTSKLRVITFREGRILPLYESLVEGRNSYSTSCCFGITLRGKNFLLNELLARAAPVLRLRATGVSSTSHSSRRKNTSTLRIIIPNCC